jgi:hypothetical protein
VIIFQTPNYEIKLLEQNHEMSLIFFFVRGLVKGDLSLLQVQKLIIFYYLELVFIVIQYFYYCFFETLFLGKSHEKIERKFVKVATVFEFYHKLFFRLKLK